MLARAARPTVISFLLSLFFTTRISVHFGRLKYVYLARQVVDNAIRIFRREPRVLDVYRRKISSSPFASATRREYHYKPARASSGSSSFIRIDVIFRAGSRSSGRFKAQGSIAERWLIVPALISDLTANIGIGLPIGSIGIARRFDWSAKPTRLRYIARLLLVLSQ